MSDTTEYLRVVERSRLQTAIHHYTHAATGREVTLVGTVHVGEPGYYRRLDVLIAERVAAGAIVHCEGTRWLPNDGANEQEQALLDRLQAWRLREGALVASLGWASCPEPGSGPRAHWEIHDITDVEIIRKIGSMVARQLDQKQRMCGETVDFRKAAARMRLFAAIGMRMAASPRMQARNADPEDEVLIDGRNAVALAALAGTSRDTVLLWGAQHVRGLDAGLRAAGFERIGTEWETAMVLPARSVSLARMLFAGVTR